MDKPGYYRRREYYRRLDESTGAWIKLPAPGHYRCLDITGAWTIPVPGYYRRLEYYRRLDESTGAWIKLPAPGHYRCLGITGAWKITGA